MTTIVGIGTMKGAWFARSEDRINWEISEPALRGWEIGTFGRSPGGDYLATTGSSWYGAAVHRSQDLVDWRQVVTGPAYAEAEDRKLERIWTLKASGATLYAGVAEAGLFRSDDDGETWDPIAGLNDHPTRPGWWPGFGGLAAHRILVDRGNPDRMWVAISAVGVLRTEDGGSTWVPVNTGIGDTVPDADYEGIGYCPHGIVADPDDPDTIWRQDHMGVYRTRDGGDSWERIENGLPARFGFPIVRDRASGSLFVIPLESDEYRMPVEGRLAVFRSDDAGTTWEKSGTGFPESGTYSGVLRGAMDTDGAEPGGIYLGTTGGTFWWSADSGATWSRLPQTFPRITSVVVLDA